MCHVHQLTNSLKSLSQDLRLRFPGKHPLSKHICHDHRNGVPASSLTQPPGCNISSKQHCSPLPDKLVVDFHSSHLLLPTMESKDRDAWAQPTEHPVQVLNLGTSRRVSLSLTMEDKFHQLSVF